ncbi:MAG: hypothetical protein GF313_13845 [Caldithrix sp.]|nr:hypothetical protein [Caldithrix sp.]
MFKKGHVRRFPVRSIKLVTTLLVVMVMAVPVFAQNFAYVQSQKILQEYDEYVEVQNRLSQIRDGYDAEYQQMVKEYNNMLDELESQSLLLSPEKKQEKRRQAQQKALQIEQFRAEKLGPEGELYKKSVEFTQPIIDKINKLIERIGKEEGYDFIFDASSGALVHADPKYDITDLIIDELNEQTNTGTTSGSN